MGMISIMPPIRTAMSAQTARSMGLDSSQRWVKAGSACARVCERQETARASSSGTNWPARAVRHRL